MRLRQIEYFVAIEKYGSFTRAAAELYVSQPSISQQVLALERELGAPLFERVPSGIALTRAGSAFLPEAQKILADVERARIVVRHAATEVLGELTVMSIRSVASNILPASVSCWHDRNPQTILSLRDYHHRKLLEEAMEAGEGDVGVGPRPRNWVGSVHSIGYEEFVLVSHDRKLLDEASADPTCLCDADWVSYDPSHGLTEVLDLLYDYYQINPRIVARSAQVEAVMSFSLDGLGVTLLPENVVPENLRSLHCARAGSGVFRELVAYTKSRPSPLAKPYIDLLLELDLQLLGESELPEGALTC